MNMTQRTKRKGLNLKIMIPAIINEGNTMSKNLNNSLILKWYTNLSDSS